MPGNNLNLGDGGDGGDGQRGPMIPPDPQIKSGESSPRRGLLCMLGLLSRGRPESQSPPALQSQRGQLGRRGRALGSYRGGDRDTQLRLQAEDSHEGDQLQMDQPLQPSQRGQLGRRGRGRRRRRRRQVQDPQGQLSQQAGMDGLLSTGQNSGLQESSQESGHDQMNRLGQQSQFGQRGGQGLHVQPQQSGIGGHLGFGDNHGRQGSIVQSGYGQSGPREQQPGLFTAGVGVNGGWQGNIQQGGHGQQAYSVNDGHGGYDGYNDENDAEEEHWDEEDDDGWGEEDEEDWNEFGDEHGGGEVGHLQPNYHQQGAPSVGYAGVANQSPWNASVGNPNMGNLGYGYQGNVNSGHANVRGTGFVNPNYGNLVSPGYSNPGYRYPGYSYPGNAAYWGPGQGGSGPEISPHGWGGHGPPVQNVFTPDSARIAQLQQRWHGDGHAGQQQGPVYYQEFPVNQSYNVLPNAYIQGPVGQQHSHGGSSGQRWQNLCPVRGQSNYRGTHRGSGRGRYRGSRRRRGDQSARRRRRKEEKRALPAAAGSLSHLAPDNGIPQREPVAQMPDDIQGTAPPTPRVKDEVVVKEEVVVKREESD